MTGAQAKTAERVTNAVLKKAKRITGHDASGGPGGGGGDVGGGGGLLVFPPTLVLTAEHDTMVKECGQALFLDALAAAAAATATTTATTNAKSTATSKGEDGEAASSCVCVVRVKVLGSYHEPLFEEERISKVVTEAVVGWLTTPPSSTHGSSSSSSSSSSHGALAPDVKVWAARHISKSNVLKMAQTAPKGVSEERAAAGTSSSSSVTSGDYKKTMTMVLLGLGVAAAVGATIVFGRRRALRR